jgi:hypothetical protein
MPDFSREQLINHLVEFCKDKPVHVKILEVLRKPRNYKGVAKKIKANKSYCSSSLKEAFELGLVKRENSNYRLAPIVKRLDINSELRKAGLKPKIIPSQQQNTVLKKIKILDFDKALENFDMDREIVKDVFPIRKPYRKDVGEAYLTVEARMRDELGLPDHLTGIEIINEAKKKGLFKREVGSEEQGIEMIYRGAILWLRNPSHHRKDSITKEDALKMIFFADYLLKLLEKQKKLNGL